MGVEVAAEVDTTEVTLGEEINFQITVGTSDVEEPDLTVLKENFQIYSKGTSSNIQIINFKKTIKKIFNYSLIPLKTGVFEIPNLKIIADGNVYKTNRIMISVANDSSQSRQGVSLDKNLFVVALNFLE